MEELELYKLIITPDPHNQNFSFVNEIGWVQDKFLVWVYYLWLPEFINGLVQIFGYGIFDDGGFDGNLQDECICIDLCEALGNFVDLEDIFPKDEYQH